MTKISEMKWNAELYKEKHSFVYDFGESLIDLLNPKFDERILDLGCGTANLTNQISDKAKDVIGIDKSIDMVLAAKQQFPDLHIYQKDAANFDFDQPFDAIFSNATLHWVLNYQSCIDSMYRNLKDDGRIVVEFGGKGNVQQIIKCLRKHLASHNYLEQSAIKQWYFPSIGEYSQALEEGGFRVVFAQHYDRLTELAESNNGLKDWIEMFAKNFFVGVQHNHKLEILAKVQEELRPELFKSGKWFADYKRIRIVAIKE